MSALPAHRAADEQPSQQMLRPSAVVIRAMGQSGRMAPVKHALLTTLLAVPLLSACATDPYSNGPDVGTRTMGGALVGAAVGALAGGAMGSSPVTGAAAGMVAGGAIDL